MFDVPHGVSIRLFGSDNVYAMYSISNKKIWVFAVKMVEGGHSGVSLKLMRCAEVECSKPVFSISLSFGFLILGEESGVRVFRLRPLVKGRVKKYPKENKDLDNGKKLPNEVNFSNGYSKGKSHKLNDSVKLKSVKLKQDSNEYGAYFVEFENKGIEMTNEQTKEGLKLVKASSIQALSPYKFLVLDSNGDLHLLRLSNSTLASETPFTMKQLPNFMRIRKLALLPDIPTKTQYVWISDGRYTIHTIAFPGEDDSESESSTKQCENKLIHCSVHQAIFCSEKIQEMVPLATNAVLILGQGSLFVYSIS